MCVCLGAKVIVAGGSISEIAMHYIEKFGMLAVKIMSKFELRRLCKAINATAMVRVGAPTPEEMGFADVVTVQEVSSRLVTVFRQHNEESAVATIVLRGSTMNLLDDMERAVDDAVHTARVRESVQRAYCMCEPLLLLVLTALPCAGALQGRPPCPRRGLDGDGACSPHRTRGCCNPWS